MRPSSGSAPQEDRCAGHFHPPTRCRCAAADENATARPPRPDRVGPRIHAPGRKSERTRRRARRPCRKRPSPLLIPGRAAGRPPAPACCGPPLQGGLPRVPPHPVAQRSSRRPRCAQEQDTYPHGRPLRGHEFSVMPGGRRSSAPDPPCARGVCAGVVLMGGVRFRRAGGGLRAHAPTPTRAPSTRLFFWLFSPGVSGSGGTGHAHTAPPRPPAGPAARAGSRRTGPGAGRWGSRSQSASGTAPR